MQFLTSLLTALVAIVVYLMGAKIPSKSNQVAVRSIAVLVGVVAMFLALSRMMVTVPTGHVGVVELFGKTDRQPLSPGLHLLNPFAHVVELPTRMRDIKETIEATSQEGLAFNIDVSLQYRIDPQQATLVYENIGVDPSEILISRFRSLVREITANYPAEAVYSTRRQEIAVRLRERLKEQLAPLGFTVEGAFLREVKLPETLEAAVQQKLKAEQESREMTFTLQKARQEAERRRIEARGIADAQKIIAASTTEQSLRLRSIEATEKLAASPNSKVVVLGEGAPSIRVDTSSQP